MTQIHRSYFIYFLFFFVVASLEPLALVTKLEVFEVVFPILKYLTLVLLLGLLGLFLCSKFVPKFFGVVFSFAIALTLISFRLSNYSAFSSLSVISFLLVVFTVVVLASVVILNAMSKSKKPSVIIYLITFILGITSPIVQLLSFDKVVSVSEQLNSDYKMEEKPNIYIFAFDSIVPNFIYKKYMNIEKIPHSTALIQDYTTIPNSLSFHVPSKPSMNDLMRLGQASEPLNYGAFSGNSNSLLSKFVKKNNYEITTGYNGLYFGNAGAFVDHGLFPETVDIQTSVLCISNRRFQKLQAGMICEVAFRMYRIKFLKPLYKVIFGDSYRSGRSKWKQELFDKIRNARGQTRPQFFYTYTYHGIGHTSSSYDHNRTADRLSYKKEVLERSETFGKQLSEVAQLIKEVDPNSIAMVFGDHGMYLSRSTTLADEPKFFIEDRHLVSISLRKNGHRCSELQNLKFKVDYVTPARTLYRIFDCLGSGRVVKAESFDEDLTILKYAIE